MKSIGEIIFFKKIILTAHNTKTLLTAHKITTIQQYW